MRLHHEASRPGSPVPENGDTTTGFAKPASQVIDLTQADLASISAARRGAPLPTELAGKLATIVGAAAQGHRVKVVHEKPAPASESKLLATLQARAAIAGFELVRMADGSFVVARWTMTRALADFAAVEAFLVQVGAA